MARRRIFLTLLNISVLFIFGCQGLWPLGGDSEKFVSANVESITNGTGDVDYLSTVGGAVADTQSAAPTESSNLSREIEEADLVKLIDHRLFVLNRSRGLRIVDVTDWSKPTMRGTVAVQGSPLEMYVNNDVATIVAVNNSLCRLDAQGQPVSQTGSMVYTVDVSNADAPQIVGTFEIDGSVSETRRVGDVVYLAGVKSWSYMGDYSNYSAEGFVASIYVADPAKVQLVDQKTFTGIGDIIHATQNVIFVTGMNWSNGMSTVQYVDISDPAGTITLRGTCQVPGYVLNRFALDAQDGVLRVVANRDWWFEDIPQTEESEGGQSSSASSAKEGEPKYGVRLYTFDISNPDSIQSMGEVFIIKNESLQAVKFDGTKAYIVTYEQRDPLWVIDLSDPAKPAITGYLEAPGYSTFLEPDGNLLVAVGIDDQDGWRACVMLYDVSDAKNPVELDRQALGENYSYSNATYDDKAFKVISEAKLVLVPFESWANGEYRSRLQMLDYSNNQLVKLAAVEQRGTAIRSNVDLESNVLWVFGEQVLQTFNIQDRNAPQSLAVLPMAENVLAWRVLGQYGLRVTTAREDWQNPAVELQTLPADSPNGHQPLASQTFDMQFYNMRLIVIDDSLAVLAGMTGEGKAKVVTIDTTALPEIRVLAERTLDVYLDNFYYGNIGVDYAYKSMGYMDVMNLMSMVNSIRRVPLWQGNQDNPMVLSNRGLVFVGVPQTESYGSSTKQLNIVSLANPADPKVVSQVDVTEGEYDMVLQIGASGTTVFNTVGQVMPDSLWQILRNRDSRLNVMYSVRFIDCSDLANPQTQDPVNVPGVTIGLRDDYVFTMDPQWSEDQIFTRFCSVKISGGKAQLISSVDLPVGEPAPVRFVSDAAVFTLTKPYWYGLYPVAAESVSSRVAKETECSMGSTRVVSVNLADPANLAVASDTEYAGLGCIAGAADSYVIGQAWSSYQGLILKVGDDKALSLSKVIDMPPAVSDVSSANGTIYICCGPAGVVTVNP